MEILTDELLDELMFSSSLDSVLSKTNKTEMSLSDHLNMLLLQKNMKKSVVIKNSQLNETFAYQIFSGDRFPTRNKVLQLAFAFSLNFSETQILLRCSNNNGLYCKNRRDAIIIFCLSNGLSLNEADDKLYSFREETIS